MPSFIRRISCVLGVLLAFGGLAKNNLLASEIVSFAASPTDPTLPDIQLTGTGAGKSLTTGFGFTSNGDGLLPPAAQTSPGVDIFTPFTIPVPGSVVHPGGQTDIYDSSISITNLVVSGLAAPDPLFPTLLVQGYAGNGTLSAAFTIFSTPAGGGPVLLLSGTLANATLTGLAGTTATSVLSGTVTYTGGVIDTALLAAGYSQNGGDMSLSLTSLTDPTTGNPEGLSIAGDGYIANANASATGLFDAAATPEPASLALVAMAALPLMRRRRQ